MTLNIQHFLVLTTILLVSANVSQAASTCKLTTKIADSPLVFHKGTTDFVYPKNGQTVLEFDPQTALELACPGGNIVANKVTYKNITVATCESGDSLKIDDREVKWNQIRCSHAVWRTAKLSGNRCENDGKEVLVGFELDDRFITVFRVCFADNTQEALYSQINITTSINQRLIDTPRPDWLASNVFSISSPNSYYYRQNQRKTINKLLGLSANSTKYIQDNDNYFLSRGHMSARSDNFYPAQQNDTFFLVNVAPQWQTNNGGNWNEVEISVRDYAEKHNVVLQQWTGVYGVTSLPHETTGTLTELYLYVEDGQKYLPVPEIYWKAVYEPQSQKGVVLIVVNNPYLKTYQPICEDVSEKIDWLSWSKKNQKLGFGYACTIESFRKVVTYFPEILVTDILS